MISFLKSIPDVSLYFLLLAILIYWLKKRNHKLFKPVVIIGVILFLISSTNYIPKKLIHSIKKTQTPIDLSELDQSKAYYIHVLGAGATLDPKLPSAMNLNGMTLTRLNEGIRIYNALDQGILVTSAYTDEGLKSQAQVSKEAAISIGVPEKNIEILPTPTTTLEEALAFKQKFGTDKNVIIVTSALHMPRATEIFTDVGLNVISAPTAFIYREGPINHNNLTFPSFKSLQLMNTYHLTVLKQWYYSFVNKRSSK